MKNLDSIERYEVMAKCYQVRFGQMAPGKSVPAAMGCAIDDLSHEKNFRRWDGYLNSDDLQNDLIAYVLRLQYKIEKLENE